ncbi:MAG: glycerophosphodiester phosphodiesterase [Actinomycetia bacterium]|nr:glycerophosphodiester phosphodiesterase [Actinomycetes bacterium]
MAPRVPRRRLSPIGFAHRGARAHAPENTLEAFGLALRLGATGLESDAWITSDGQIVLDHDGEVGGLFRRRLISEVERADLPGHIPTLAELYETHGTEFELSLDIKDPAAGIGVIEVARSFDAESGLWLCHHDWRVVADWRTATEAHLVDSTRLKWIDEGPERRAATLAEVGIDAINLHHTDWSLGLTTLFHRFELETLAWDVQHPRALDEILARGVDGVFSDHVDRLMEAIGRYES